MFTNVQTDAHHIPNTVDNTDQWIQQHYESFYLELQDIDFQFSLSAHRMLLVLSHKRYFSDIPVKGSRLEGGLEKARGIQ